MHNAVYYTAAVVTGWVGLVWCVTREIEGVAKMLTWIKTVVPERFRGTGMPSKRMRVRIYTYIHSACAHYCFC
jgi:hypothetical protein